MQLDRSQSDLTSDCSGKENRNLLKLVLLGVTISLLWKVKYFLIFDRLYHQNPIVDPFFPPFFQNADVLRWTYVLACTASSLSLFLKTQRLLVISSIATLASCLILNIHQSSYNDVTFLCCSWSALWCCWLASRLHESPTTLAPRAAWIGQVILSLIFLGGTIGKLTPEYFSGDVLHEIYFKQRDFWIYNWVRNTFSSEMLPTISVWHSRMVIFGEGTCCFLWLMPRKFASLLAIVMLNGIALTNNLLLYSVLTSLICLAVVGLHESPDPKDSPPFQPSGQ